MGVKTKLSLYEINSFFDAYNFVSIKNTKEGITDTVYILKDINKKSYVLKLYENSSFKKVEEEIIILKSIRHLKCVLVIDTSKKYKKPLVLFSFEKAQVKSKFTFEHLKQISIFLRQLHNVDFDYNISGDFELKFYLENFVKSDEFLKRFEFIKTLKLEKNCLIHGDLFPDNVLFYKNSLKRVIDFSNSCIGDKQIDLATVVLTWCYDNNRLDINKANFFLQEYDKSLTIDYIKDYLLYVCLYYATKRYINLKNGVYKDVSYKHFLNMFDNIVLI